MTLADTKSKWEQFGVDRLVMAKPFQVCFVVCFVVRLFATSRLWFYAGWCYAEWFHTWCAKGCLLLASRTCHKLLASVEMPSSSPIALHMLIKHVDSEPFKAC